MIKSIVFDKEISLYWLYDDYKENCVYEIFVNGEFVGATKKTHYELTSLTPCKSYDISIDRVYYGGNREKFASATIKTKKEKRVIDITSSPYNAVGDGVTLNTEGIQRALNDCTEEDEVYIPEGVFLTGALDIHSNCTLHLAKGGILQGSKCACHYLPKIKSRFEGIEMLCYRSLINLGELNSKGGYTENNVVIYGEGSIIGGGNQLKNDVISIELVNMKDEIDALHNSGTCNLRSELIAGRTRGRLISIFNSENVVVYGVSMEFGPAWNEHIVYSKNVITAKCSFRSFGIENGDGCDPDSSVDCVIYGCEFDMGDDCIAIKSGKNPEGNVINRSSSNIYVFDCYSVKGHGCSLGSEMSGGIENVYVWDCDFTNTLYGLHIKATAKRGGYIKNVHVRNSSFSCVYIRTVGYNDDGVGASTLPVFKDFDFKGLSLTGIMYLTAESTDTCYAVYVNGFSDPEYHFKNISFGDIKIKDYADNYDRFVSVSNCDNCSIGSIIKY